MIVNFIYVVIAQIYLSHSKIGTKYTQDKKNLQFLFFNFQVFTLISLKWWFMIKEPQNITRVTIFCILVS